MGKNEDNISEEVSGLKQEIENYLSLNDDAEANFQIGVINKVLRLSAISIFIIAVLLYFFLIWVGLSQFSSAVVTILGMLSGIIYSIEFRGCALHHLLLILRADNRAHYKTLFKYIELSIISIPRKKRPL